MVKYYIIIDFEATCDLRENPDTIEIIEFPAVVIDANTHKIVNEVQFYVKPVHHPILTQFCTELTGITQEQVDTALEFTPTLHQFMYWLHKNQYTDSTIITCSDWDFGTMFPAQCKVSHLSIPDRFRTWLDIVKEFISHYHKYANSMGEMMEILGIPLTGRVHSGIDDCRNLAKVWCRMLQDGYSPTNTSYRTLKM